MNAIAAFFAGAGLATFVTATVCALRRDPLGTNRRLYKAEGENAALREENEMLRAERGQVTLPTGDGSRS